MSRGRVHRGFTLIELVLVIGILALITHLAVVSTSDMMNKSRVKLASKQLSEIDKALKGIASDFISGFVCDMGRLPYALPVHTNEASTICLGVPELWRETLPKYELLDARTAARVVGSAALDVEMDDKVYVGCGWRGPYLDIAINNQRLSDAWGNYYESPSSGGAYGMLLNKIFASPANGEEVVVIGHFGSDGIKDELAGLVDAERRDAAITNDFSGTKLVLNVEGYSSTGNLLPGLSAVKVRMYMPRIESEDAKIFVVEKTGTPPFVFDNLVPGVKQVRVKVGTQTPWPVKEIVVRPGSNYEVIKLGGVN